MVGRQRGVTLIELLIVMALLAVVIAMSSFTFTEIISQSRQQTQITATQLEEIVALEMMRVDIEHAGHGLPWSFQNTINYSEASAAPANAYNDSPSNPPRPFACGNGAAYNSSDYLVIKSTNASTSDTAQRWTYVVTGQNPHTWGSNNLANGDRVIVINPKADETSLRELVMNGAVFFTGYSNTSFASNFSPKNPSGRYLIYGVDHDTDLRMPFNRVDYYVNRPNSGMPVTCAHGTGILYRATVNQADGRLTELPVLDCVADMQVIFNLDGSQTDDISAFSPEDVRDRIREVRVYILTHEGGRDKSYKYPSSTVTVGEFGLGSNFDLATVVGSGWQNYRWKVITMVIKPKNL